MFDVVLTVRTNPPDLASRLASGPMIVEEETLRTLTRMQELGASVASGAAPVDRGALRGSFFLGGPSSASIVTAQLARIDSALPYVEAQENAAKYTKGTWWPPAAPIEAWVQRKGLAAGGDVEGVAFLVRRKIATSGISPHNFMEAAFNAILADLPAEEQALSQRIAARIP